jgi:hypothetical protein
VYTYVMSFVAKGRLGTNFQSYYHALEELFVTSSYSERRTETPI